MTFDQIVSAVQNRLNLTSSESATRIGTEVNDRYKRVTSSCGLNTTRRTTVQADMTIGVDTLTFTPCVKIINVVDRTGTPYRVLKEVSVEEIRQAQPQSNTTPTKYAILSTTSTTVTILTDAVPESALTLYADCYGRASTLATTDEPVFDEDFHDILMHGALADEYRKMEKTKLALESEALYERRLGELRYFLAKSVYRDVMQGGNRKNQLSGVGASGGSGSSINGATSWTQTGLITFDRTSAAVGSRYPFAVAVGGEKVANLDADKLDGLDSTAFRLVATSIVEADFGFTDLTTADVTSTKHGLVPKAPADATKFLNGAATPAFAQVKGSDLSMADVTTNDVSTTKHGFVPKAPNTTTQFLRGDGAWSTSGQIPFPATQNPSANVNTLDDYEEGTWTPIITGSTSASGQTYTTQAGTYTKIGNQVTISCKVQLSAVGTITGTVGIGGLPFPPANTVGNNGGASIGYWGPLTTSIIALFARITPNLSAIFFAYRSSAGTTLTEMVQADLAATTEFRLTATYLT